MQAEDPTGTKEYRIRYRPQLFEAALRAAATAHGLPASCRRRACRDSGLCAMAWQPWNGEIDRGCKPDFAIARAAAEHIDFLHLLGWSDPEGTVYDDLVAPYMESFPKIGPRPAARSEVWARMIAVAFAIPVPSRSPKKPKAQPASAGTTNPAPAKNPLPGGGETAGARKE